MGHPAEARRLACYADLEAAPPGQLAELVGGQLYLFPRPAPRHAFAAGQVHLKIGGPFGIDGRPGGWWILPEPEIRFANPGTVDGFDVASPDLAGWRRERVPDLPETAYWEIAPDWVCEVLSPSTKQHDRTVKMPLYASAGVSHAWLVDPIARTLEAYALGRDRHWKAPAIYREKVRVRAEPFEAIEFPLDRLWV
ncbi:MAG: Uma2 family endonuclease [Byssovorax sp.]